MANKMNWTLYTLSESISYLPFRPWVVNYIKIMSVIKRSLKNGNLKKMIEAAIFMVIGLWDSWCTGSSKSYCSLRMPTVTLVRYVHGVWFYHFQATGLHTSLAVLSLTQRQPCWHQQSAEIIITLPGKTTNEL
jgi:hypothetical protein